MEKISVKEFCRKMSDNYGYLYDNYDNVKGYRALVKAGDACLQEFADIVKLICDYRQDGISSDRECAAFALTLADYGII